MPSAVFTPWRAAVVNPATEPGTVHLWRFRLSGFPAENLLTPDELQRAQRLRVPEKSRSFIVARTRLRQILARYLGADPQDLEFRLNAHGKPFLAGASIQFNLSHSARWGLCAVSPGDDVGVDLEAINPALDYESLAARYFSTQENAWLKSFPESRRCRGFFRLWTRKEAWLKGKGGGFSELRQALPPDHIAGTSTVANGWWLINLPVANGYVGAVAVAGSVERVVRWSWESTAAS